MKKMNSYELLITLEDKDLVKVSEQFIYEIETKFKKFNQRYKEYYKKEWDWFFKKNW